MKLFYPNHTRPQRRSLYGFTLVEMYCTVAIFLMIVGAMVAVQIFGLRVYTLSATKLTATEGGRKAPRTGM